MSERYVIVHGHFYQPPRENPWLDVVEAQPSAHPYHDWNERVTAEAYAPNAASRILGGGGRIRTIVNNYAQISFDFGPTLLAWLELARPDVYGAILEADRVSRERFSGHGSALAQAHSHLILPLANRRDKVTEVRWGIRDFEHRFGRFPEGMWLPETAVDLETLEILAEEGLRFTLLAPHQALGVRPLEEEGPVSELYEATIDSRRPHFVRLPSGRSLAVFFYDGELSQEIAFDDLLGDGERFAEELLAGLEAEGEVAPGEPRLVHVATDGETYGHHHRHGEMALSRALEEIEAGGEARLTNYGELLERHPPDHEIILAEATSWSCAHGVERWRSDCGCRTGGEKGWNQRWRAPLRAAIDQLRDDLAKRYEAAAAGLLTDPWAARDGYLSVLLDRSEPGRERFLAEHRARPLEPAERTRVFELLELERMSLAMQTSCGWFFHDLAGIETVQVLRYAARALELARELFGEDLEERFLATLEEAVSNHPEEGSGRQVFERHVRPARVDLPTVVARYALTSLFEEEPDSSWTRAHRIERRRFRLLASGARLALGEVEITAALTGRRHSACFAAFHLGGHQVVGGVAMGREEAPACAAVEDELAEAFEAGDLPRVVRCVEAGYRDRTFSLASLLSEEHPEVLSRAIAGELAEVDEAMRRIHEEHASLLGFLNRQEQPLPAALRVAVELGFASELERTAADPEADLDPLRQAMGSAGLAGAELAVADRDALALALRRGIALRAQRLEEAPDDLERMERLAELVELAGELPLDLVPWEAQNVVWAIARRGPGAARTEDGDDGRCWEEWTRRLVRLGDLLGVAVG